MPGTYATISSPEVMAHIAHWSWLSFWLRITALHSAQAAPHEWSAVSDTQGRAIHHPGPGLISSLTPQCLKGPENRCRERKVRRNKETCDVNSQIVLTLTHYCSKSFTESHLISPSSNSIREVITPTSQWEHQGAEAQGHAPRYTVWGDARAWVQTLAAWLQRHGLCSLHPALHEGRKEACGRSRQEW